MSVASWLAQNLCIAKCIENESRESREMIEAIQRKVKKRK